MLCGHGRRFERFAAALCADVLRAKRAGRRVVAIGTTSVRALEAAPGYRDATVFLAQLRMEAGDVAGAVPLLEEMLTWDDLDAATRAQLEETLELASQS